MPAIVTAFIAFAGFFACPMHTIFVERSDSESRVKAMKEIQRRARDAGQWPTTLIFPEGAGNFCLSDLWIYVPLYVAVSMESTNEVTYRLCNSTVYKGSFVLDVMDTQWSPNSIVMIQDNFYVMVSTYP